MYRSAVVVLVGQVVSLCLLCVFFFFFSSRRRHTRYWRDWSSDVCSSDLCIDSYTANFGTDSANIVLLPDRIQVTVREERDGKWQVLSKVEVVSVPDMPGFRVERGEYSMAVEFGLLPSDKLFYRDREQDKYLTMEEFTRRILDRALFPALREP